MSHIDTVKPDTRNKSISDPDIKTWRIIYLSKISNILTGAFFKREYEFNVSNERNGLCLIAVLWNVTYATLLFLFTNLTSM